MPSKQYNNADWNRTESGNENRFVSSGGSSEARLAICKYFVIVWRDLWSGVESEASAVAVAAASASGGVAGKCFCPPIVSWKNFWHTGKYTATPPTPDQSPRVSAPDYVTQFSLTWHRASGSGWGVNPVPGIEYPTIPETQHPSMCNVSRGQHAQTRFHALTLSQA